MRKHIRRKQEAHRRAQLVFEENRDVIEATDGGKKSIASLNASVDDVDRLFIDQQHALNERRNASADVQTARQTIRAIAKAIVGVSRVVALGEGSATAMIDPSVISDELLASQAAAIYETAAAHADAFAKAGLPAGDLPLLRDQIAALKAARTRASNARKTFTAAAKQSRKAAKSGDDAIVVVDAILSRTPNADPKAVTKLRLAKRIGPSQAGEPPVAQPTPAATQPNPAPTTPTQAA